MKILSASNDNQTQNVGGGGSGVLKSLSRWIKVSGIARSLHQLDDRTLDDIGIRRENIRLHAERIVDNDNKTAA